MKKTRVGVVGMGMIGRAHMDALRRIPQVEVAAIVEPMEEAAREAALQFDIPHWYTDAYALIASGRIDALHNCTPNALHDDINRAAIDAGLHIYAEKPLSNTAADAREIWGRAEMRGIVHACNYQYRMNAAVQEMRVRARRDMGRVFLISGHYHQQSGLYDTDFGWRMTEGGLSCGLSDIGTHWVDTARCITGLEPLRVLASMQTIHPQRTKPDGTRIDVRTDDLSSVLIDFEGGVQGALTVSKVSAGHMNDLALGVDGQQFSLYWQQESATRLTVGYKGAPNLSIEMAPQLADPSVRPLVRMPGGHSMGWYDALLASVGDFYAAVRGDIAREAMRCATFADGFAGMAFVEACLKSSRTDAWADVEQA